jgi:phospholipid/cholesterol/gamma-HCH transport system permease protein
MFFIYFINDLGNFTLFFFRILKSLFMPPYRWRLIFQEMEFAGNKSFVVVCMAGTFAGMVVALGSYVGFVKLGAEEWLGSTVCLAVVTQLAPILTGFMVAAKVGAAYTAEIGTMRVTEQIDALEVMALNPYRYLIVPNFIAGVLSFPLLAGVFDVVGIYGGYLVGVKLLGVSAGTFFGEMHYFIDMTEILHGIYKSLCFGLIVMWVCCYRGFNAGYGAEGVSKATTQAVVTSSVLVLVFDYL